VKSKLAEELGASTVTNVSVNVTNGVVTLAGTVHDSAEKSKAVSIAQGVPKVVRVNDNLQIPPTLSGRQSSTLRDAVQLDLVPMLSIALTDLPMACPYSGNNDSVCSSGFGNCYLLFRYGVVGVVDGILVADAGAFVLLVNIAFHRPILEYGLVTRRLWQRR